MIQHNFKKIFAANFFLQLLKLTLHLQLLKNIGYLFKS